MKLTLSPRQVLRFLLAIVLLLTLLGITVQTLRYVYGFDYQLGLYSLLNVGADSNLPTWYASVSLLFCSALLAAIAAAKQRQGDRFTLHWWILSATFLLLSIDETARIHETLVQNTAVDLIGAKEGFFSFPG